MSHLCHMQACAITARSRQSIFEIGTRISPQCRHSTGGISPHCRHTTGREILAPGSRGAPATGSDEAPAPPPPPSAPPPAPPPSAALAPRSRGSILRSTRQYKGRYSSQMQFDRGNETDLEADRAVSMAVNFASQKRAVSEHATLQRLVFRLGSF